MSHRTGSTSRTRGAWQSAEDDLPHLVAIERLLNAVRADASSLRLCFECLAALSSTGRWSRSTTSAASLRPYVHGPRE
jgi:hypothetical protein